MELGSWGPFRSVEDSLGQAVLDWRVQHLLKTGPIRKAAWQSVCSDPPYSLTPHYAVM